MKKLEIEHSGPSLWEDFNGHGLFTKIEDDTLAYPLYCQFEHADRLDIETIRYVENPWDWTRDEVIRTQAAAHDAMVRDNLALSKEVGALRRENEGLRADVKLAEKHYEMVCASRDIAQEQVAAIGWVLRTGIDPQPPPASCPTLDSARKVMADLRSAKNWLSDRNVKLAERDRELSIAIREQNRLREEIERLKQESL